MYCDAPSRPRCLGKIWDLKFVLRTPENKKEKKSSKNKCHIPLSCVNQYLIPNFIFIMLHYRKNSDDIILHTNPWNWKIFNFIARRVIVQHNCQSTLQAEAIKTRSTTIATIFPACCQQQTGLLLLRLAKNYSYSSFSPSVRLCLQVAQSICSNTAPGIMPLTEI